MPYTLSTTELLPRSDRGYIRRRATIAADWAKQDGKRDRFAPSPSTPAVHRHGADAGRPRALADVLAELRKIIARDRREDNGRCERAEQDRTRVAHGWRAHETNGHFAICRWDAIGADGRNPYRPVGQLDAETWDAYGRVRILRKPAGRGAHAVRWTFADGHVTAYAADPEVGHAIESTPMAGYVSDEGAGPIFLSDRYLWPLRGASWVVHVATVGRPADSAVVFASVEDPSIAVVVMPMREGA